ncbi:hypothetical protein IJG79_00180 [Candidatus Saccharibacteria bacterium]|nr:hypothetical protein [Candidatus Saccharibacteria bacterium]
MDPKQTAPQGGQPGGPEGQANQPQSTGANPVFGGAGTLGGNTLSTGANVSQTIDSLNSGKLSASGTTLLQRKRVDNVDPVTGDIIIASNPNEKTSGGTRPINKALLIKLGIAVLIIGAIALVVGIVIAFVSGGDKKNNSSNSNNSAPAVLATNADQAFNEYANYMLYGSSSQAAVSENVNIYSSYEIDKMVNAKNDESKDFFKNARLYLDNFVQTFNNSELKEKSYLLPYIVPEYQGYFDFVYNYIMANPINRATMLQVYSEGGSAGVDQFFADNYSIFNELDSIESKSYYNYMNEVVVYYKKFIELAERRKCIDGDTIIDSCSINMGASDVEKYEESAANAATLVQTSTNVLKSGINSINKQIQNPQENQTDDGVTINANGIKSDNITVNINQSEGN